MRVTVARETSVPVMLTVPTLQVAGGQAREVDGPPGVRHTQQRQAEQKGQDHPDQAQGVHEQHAPYQVVLELVVAGEGCEGTQAEQGTSNLAVARARWRARLGGPVWVMMTVILSWPLHSMYESDQ